MADELGEYVDMTKAILIAGNPVKIAVKTKDAGRFFLALKGLDDNNEMQVDKISSLAIKMIKSANPEMKDEDVQKIVMYNFTDIIKEISVALGFAKREDFNINPKNPNSQ